QSAAHVSPSPQMPSPHVSEPPHVVSEGSTLVGPPLGHVSSHVSHRHAVSSAELVDFCFSMAVALEHAATMRSEAVSHFLLAPPTIEMIFNDARMTGSLVENGLVELRARRGRRRPAARSCATGPRRSARRPS